MAAPVPSVTPSRTSGRVPLGVFFDATGTTDADVNAFRDLYYQWSFGDSGAGTWEYGANTAMPKNGATGPMAGHVYETAGTYQWSNLVYDGTTAIITVGTITASDWPNDANTVCIGNTLPVAGVNGVPSNATCVASSDFDAAVAANIGTNKRLLFNRVDTFPSSAAAVLTTTGPAMIGGYGAGTAPLITSSSISGVIRLSTAAADIRIGKLEITGAGAADTGAAITIEAAAVSDITILEPVIHNIGKGIIVTGSGENALVDSVIQGASIYDIQAASGGVGIFGKFVTTAILGNSVGPFATAAEHNIRVQPGQKVVVSNNTATTPGDTGKCCLTIRAGEHSTAGDPDPVYDTQYVYFSDNKLIYPRGGAVGAQPLEISPASTSQNNWISDVIGERNIVQARASAATSSEGAKVSASRVTLRNNLFDMSGSPSGMTGVSVQYTNVAGAPVPDDVRILNNTMYAGTSAGSFVGVDIDTEPTATVVNNNIAYAPSSVSRDMISGTGTSPGSLTNNSSDAQVLTDPLFTGPLTSPQGFRFATTSYAQNAGTALFPTGYADFYNADDVTANVAIGAFVPRVRASSKGVAA